MSIDNIATGIISLRIVLLTPVKHSKSKSTKSILEKTEAIIIEFGCLEAYIDRTTPNDVMGVMYQNNYALYDIIDLIYRPYDNALTGGDFIFVKNDSPIQTWDDVRQQKARIAVLLGSTGENDATKMFPDNQRKNPRRFNCRIYFERTHQ